MRKKIRYVIEKTFSNKNHKFSHRTGIFPTVEARNLKVTYFMYGVKFNLYDENMLENPPPR